MSGPDAHRCEAKCSTHGQRCRAPARVCWTHAKSGPPRLLEQADGDATDVVRANNAMLQVMNHPEWPAVPAEIRRLVEGAWLALWSATEGHDS